MKTFFSAAFPFFFTLALAGCAATAPDDKKARNFIANEAQTGTEIALDVGRQLEIHLQGNRSTGYQWLQTEPMRGILRDASPRYETTLLPEGSTEPRIIGSGGTEIFVFTAARPGTQTLTFEYRRAWETDKMPARQLQYRIAVN